MSYFVSVYNKQTNTGEIVNTIFEVSAITKISIRTLTRYISGNKIYISDNYIIFRRKVDKNYNKIRSGRKGGTKRIENKRQSTVNNESNDF